MANFVQNCVTITGTEKEIDRFWNEQCKHFSFNRIVPMPKTLYIISGSISEVCYEIVEKLLSLPSMPKTKEEFCEIFGDGLTWFEDLPGSLPEDLSHLPEIPEYLLDAESKPKTKGDAIVLGYTMIQNETKYGFCDWYDWRIANWGTKWEPNNFSASRDSESAISMFFKTAWHAPEPIYRVLSTKYPQFNFVIEYADEDLGYNCGTYKVTNGVLSFTKPGNEDESFDFACDVWCYDADEM